MSDGLRWTCRRCAGKGRLMRENAMATDISIARYCGALDSLYETCPSCKGAQLVSTEQAALQEHILPLKHQLMRATGEPAEALRQRAADARAADARNELWGAVKFLLFSIAVAGALVGLAWLLF